MCVSTLNAVCWPYTKLAASVLVGGSTRSERNALLPFHHPYVVHEWTHRPDKLRRPSKREAGCLLPVSLMRASDFACAFAAFCLQVEKRQQLRLTCMHVCIGCLLAALLNAKLVSLQPTATGRLPKQQRCRRQESCSGQVV